MIETAFRTRHPDETHRARLRVEMGRLRALAKLHGAGQVRAIGQARAPLAVTTTGRIHDNLVTPCCAVA